ncbi:ABC transporter permease [Emticicia sp. C21]|uniref:ABC transporter permease n=1 Tax=Emticicia sp. C21 TaxID=2302915 RepID=UPI0013140B29|nr:ABC transporter permease [Emticicia sp. C21]
MQKPIPPRWADKLLEWFCAPHLLEEVQGDLYERFQKNLRVFGVKIARKEYTLGVLSFIKPFALKRERESRVSSYLLFITMIKSYFKIAWRNIRRDVQFTMLNLSGLAIGLTGAFMIYLWVNDELSVDKNHEKDARLYQILQTIPKENDIETGEYTAGILAKSMAAEFPEIAYATPVIPASWFSSKGIVRLNETKLKAKGQFVGKDYFQMFDCNFLQGDKNTALADKHAVAISDELAMKLFNTTHNVVGKTIEWNQNEFNGPYLITGVFEANPPNVSEPFDILFNFDLFVEKRPGMLKWGNSDPRTYLLLKEGTNVAAFNKKIEKYMQGKEKNSKRILLARPFSDKYLYGKYENGVQVGGRITYVKLFVIIAIFILIIACINFMNLSTAKASQRMKEVGVKKVVGASRSSLIFQYISESVLLSFLALILSTVLIFLLLPAFNEITGKNLFLNFNWKVVVAMLGITLFAGILAGSYPALYISGFNPVAVLKGKLKTSVGELWVRKGLVVFQFTLSVIFIAGVLVVYKQISYIQSKNLGYSRDHVIHFEIPLEKDSVKRSTAISFINELREIPGVVNAGSYYHNLTGQHGGIGGFQWPGKDPSVDFEMANLEVGPKFLETMNIRIKEGRNFSSNPEKEMILNETAIKEMGLKNPIGKTIRYWDRERQIVGVAEDFNFESLYQEVKPCFFQIYSVMPNVLVRLQGGNEQQTIDRIQQAYASFNKGMAFEYRFLDDDYQALYTSENRVGVLSRYFASLAIIISCLGLFGLAAFTAQRRQKEIGIRKVVGATVTNVAILLSKDFFQLIIVALVIAFPIVAWGTKEWLASFAYRTTIGTDIYILTAVFIILITLCTVSYQAIKAALMNPVKTLKTE